MTSCLWGEERTPPCGVKVRLWRGLPAALVCVLLIAVLALPSDLAAQVEGYPEPKGDLSFSLGGATFHRFPAKVDGGGTLSVFSLRFSADISKKVTEKLGIGVGFGYEFDDYNFSGLTGFSVSRPWKQVQRLGLSLPLFYFFADNWRLICIPTVQFSGEFGARFGDALVYGGVVGVSHRFGPNLELGLGLAGYYNLEEARVFPVPIVKIKFSERFRLTNPFRIGPAGPAGLELSYLFRGPWEIGLGGAYRSSRFRLDYDGPIPNGIGEYKSIPVFARLSYKPFAALRIDAYGGASFLNKLYVNDRDGNELYRTTHKVAPLVGLSISGRF